VLSLASSGRIKVTAGDNDGWTEVLPIDEIGAFAFEVLASLRGTLGAVANAHVKTTSLETAERGRSPLGAYIRHLMDGAHGNMIHSTVPPGMVGRACRFQTIEEYWYVLAGMGEIRRRAADGRESVTRLIPGVSVDISRGTTFQYRCTGDEALVFTCTAMPPWPGDDEAVIVDGPWAPRVDGELGGSDTPRAAHTKWSSGS
jgi:mannose-6-phosphate isomerase-like protein (cupin superfamily)